MKTTVTLRWDDAAFGFVEIPGFFVSRKQQLTNEHYASCVSNYRHHIYDQQIMHKLTSGTAKDHPSRSRFVGYLEEVDSALGKLAL